MSTVTGQKFTARFIGLVIVGYLIGVVMVGWSVWLVSRPILEDMSLDAQRDLIQAEAVSLSLELDTVTDAVDYLVNEDTVQDFITGFEEFENVVEDHVSELFADRNFLAVALFDFTGERIYQRNSVGAWITRSGFTGSVDRMVVDVLASTDLDTTPTIRMMSHGLSQELHIIIVQPVVSRNLLEGIAVVELRLNTSGLLLPGTWVEGHGLATEFRFLEEGVLTRVPIGETGLVLAGSVSAEEATATGLNLVRSVLATVIVVLAVPFIAILALGYRVLVEPQRRLAASERELLRQSNDLVELASIVKAFHEAILTTDENQCIVWVNPAFERLSGFPESEVLGRRLQDFMERGDENEAANAELQLAYATYETMRAELLYHRADDTQFWVNASVTPIFDDNGDVFRFAMILSDVTNNKAYEAELRRTQEETRFRSLHDALTGLPNRRYFDEMSAPFMEDPSVDRSLVRIDLDYFKAVNDNFGHAAGDHVLCVVAELMRAFCEEDDFPARVGGDEFLIFLGVGKSEADAEELCLKLRSEIQRDIPFEGSICRVGASFGVSSSGLSFVDTKDILVSADAALYKSKDDGRNRITLYTPELHASVQESRRLSIELEVAFANEDFEPWFQPQFDAVSGQLSGVEALARWNHPERGVVEPWRFMPSVEKLGLMEEMDNIIYRKGLAIIEQMNKDRLLVPKVSFNVSNRQIENPVLGSIADGFDLNGAQIRLEILESVVVEEMADEKLANLFALREVGFGLELDDFGSGHASIAGLLKLRPDVIKIDKMLVQPVVDDPVAQELIASIVDIGRALGVSVTAEGAETLEHVEILRGCGCKYLQGYFMSRPVPWKTLMHRIQNNEFPDIADPGWEGEILMPPIEKQA